MPGVHFIHPRQPQTGPIEQAAGIICDGGVVILPTHGLYGVGCDAHNAASVERIFDIKRRPQEKPLLVLISNAGMLADIVVSIPSLAESLMASFWPGRLTLVMEGRKDLPPGLCSDDGKVGVRMVGHPVASAVVEAAGTPVTGTSANLTGAGGCDRIDAIDQIVTDAVDIILDAGVLAGGPGSSVVDVTGRAPRILREGAVAAAEISQVLGAGSTSRVDKGG